MNCQKCGSPLVPGDKFCKTCGTAVGQESSPMMNQMPNGMDNQMNNNMMMPEQNQMNNNMMMSEQNQMNNMQQEQKQHPLMMDQSALNMNAMSMNSHMNMNMNDPMQNDTINMGNNQFVPSNNMNTMDNSMNNMSPMNNNMNTMGMDNSMNNMNGMGMDNTMNNMNSMNGMNQIPQPMSMPSAMNNMMNTPMSVGPMGAMTPQNNNSKFIIAGIAIVVVVLISIFLFGGNSAQKGNEVGKGNDQVDKDVPTYTVQLSGFSFEVPQTYVYEIKNGYLVMTDESDEWIVRLSVQKLSYETLKKNIAQLKPTAEKKGYTAEPAELKTFNGVELIKFNFEASGVKYNGGYAKINSMYLTTIEGFNKDNTYDEDLLKKAAAIIKTAKYTGESANMQIAIPDGAINMLEFE